MIRRLFALLLASSLFAACDSAAPEISLDQLQGMWEGTHTGLAELGAGTVHEYLLMRIQDEEIRVFTPMVAFLECVHDNVQMTDDGFFSACMLSGRPLYTMEVYLRSDSTLSGVIEGELVNGRHPINLKKVLKPQVF